MKKLIIGGIAAAALAAGVATATPANATIAVIGSRGDYSAVNYRDELRYSGIVHEDLANATELGPRICRQRGEGYSERVLIDSLEGPDTPYNVQQSIAIVLGAEFHFCPGYENDGSLSAAPYPSPPPPPPGYYSGPSQIL